MCSKDNFLLLGGYNWTQTSAPYANWYSISSDCTGIFIVAGQATGSIYASSSGILIIFIAYYYYYCHRLLRWC